MWRFIKIPKVIALLAFFLPWMTVSCSNQKVADASGWQLVTGHIRPVVDAARSTDTGTHLNPFLVLALVMIAAGLIVSLVSRPAPLPVLVSSLTAIVLIWAGTSRYTSEAIADAARKRGGDDVSRLGATLIRVDWQFGFWIAIVALAIATMMAWIAWGEIRKKLPSG